ncbi:MAG: hypothetical protein DCC68_22160 [Planctomycetota bacterium]|nr:MAG: hypothetical protein DCC68_22160 [Planctomycetota bacterium]
MAKRLLLPQHLDDLRGSGLSDATIAAARFYSETDPREVARLLNRKRVDESLAPALVIPFFGLDGEPTDFARVKPDRPPVDSKGKAAKYLQPSETPLRAYYPPRAIVLILNPAGPLIIVEGEKKALAIAS